MDTNELVKFGLFVEAFTFPELPMPRAVDEIVIAAESGKLNLSKLVPPAMSPDPLAAMRELQSLLPTLDHGNNQNDLFIASPCITFVTLATTVLRLYGRKRTNGALKKADWCAVVAATSRPLHNGASGHHIWDLSFAQFRYFAGMVVLNETVFYICATLVRLPWLAFYYELSPNTAYRRLMVAASSFILTISIVSIPVIILQCRPVNIWNGTNIFTAKCVDKKKLFSALGALTIISDVILLVLPITLVLRLKKMKPWEKLQIMAIFGAGGLYVTVIFFSPRFQSVIFFPPIFFLLWVNIIYTSSVCILTLMRVLGLNEVLTKTDLTYINTPPLIWATAELDSTIIVANLPAIRSLFSSWYHMYKADISSPSTFVIRTDGEQAWGVEDGGAPPDLDNTSSSSGGTGPSSGLGKRRVRRAGFFTRATKAVTDSSLFRGSLFRDTTMKSRGEPVTVEDGSCSDKEKDPDSDTVQDCRSNDITAGGSSKRTVVEEVKETGR